VGDSTFLSSIDYDSAGTLHGIGFQGDSSPSLFTLDQGTGAATPVTTLNDGTNPIFIGVLGFAIAHPCTPTPPPTPPTPAPAVVETPRFTG
jgi:hypothetical protein